MSMTAYHPNERRLMDLAPAGSTWPNAFIFPRWSLPRSGRNRHTAPFGQERFSCSVQGILIRFGRSFREPNVFYCSSGNCGEHDKKHEAIRVP